MIKMEQEVVDLLKELVGRLQSLERTVYDNDNLLMKSGLVRVNTPTPGISHNSSDGLDSDAIAKMDWSDIHLTIQRLEDNL